MLADKMYEAKANARELLGERVLPWDGIGQDVQSAITIDEVMEQAGLDFTVKQTELKADINGLLVPTGHFANYRTDNNEVLGVVKGRYEVVNNSECFDFVNDIVCNGDIPIQFNTAGVIKGGRRTWLSCVLPPTHVLGDDFNPYLVFANSHDGSTGITVSVTNIRVWCENTLNMAIRDGQRAFSFTHSASVKAKMEEAKRTLENYKKYQKGYEREAERLYNRKMTNQEVKDIFDKLFPIDAGNMSDRKICNLVAQREAVQIAYESYDVQHDFANTAWGVLNAIGDFTSHNIPQRKTATYRENRIESLWNGNKLFDKAHSLLVA